MNKAAITLALSLAAVCVGPARGQYYNGEALREACEVKVAFVNGVCEGYVTGIADAAAHFGATEGLAHGLCIPAGTKSTRLIRVVIEYLEARRGAIGDDAAVYVRAALAEAFPCH
jgi:hypothetical protein